MTTACTDCGGQRTYVRARYEIVYPFGTFIAEEVPSLRCETCDRNEPAHHIRAQFDAVLELAQEVPEATVRKDFTSLPLRPADARP